MVTLPLARPPALRLLVLAIAGRCDQKCVHCQIWTASGARGAELALGERLAIVEEALEAGIEECLITGGEPLLSSDLWPLAERLRQGGVRSMLATNGMLLSLHAARVGSLFDEVYVSLDGASAASHDGLRGVPAFERVASGVAALKSASPRVRVVARSTLHARNVHELEAIVEAARRMGFDNASFLALDASSGAFGGEPAARRCLVPSAAQVTSLEAAIGRLERASLLGGFVLESAAKLRALARHLRASGGAGRFERPRCDAPWWSSVVEPDGAMRPCFFHAQVGDAREGLRSLRSSRRYRGALAGIRAENPTCRRCVCPKSRGISLRERLWA
jgi:MoaA/NifB/PqqE/SkfB family radical SAM enzyme